MPGDGDKRLVGVAPLVGLQKVRHHPLEKLDSVLVEVGELDDFKAGEGEGLAYNQAGDVGCQVLGLVSFQVGELLDLYWSRIIFGYLGL